MPVCQIVLCLRGSVMMSVRVGSKASRYFDTSLQQFLIAKVFLALIIFIGVICLLGCKVIKKELIIFMKEHYNKVVLVFIVLFAKLMFLHKFKKTLSNHDRI